MDQDLENTLKQISNPFKTKDEVKKSLGNALSGLNSMVGGINTNIQSIQSALDINNALLDGENTLYLSNELNSIMNRVSYTLTGSLVNVKGTLEATVEDMSTIVEKLNHNIEVLATALEIINKVSIPITNMYGFAPGEHKLTSRTMGPDMINVHFMGGNTNYDGHAVYKSFIKLVGDNPDKNYVLVFAHRRNVNLPPPPDLPNLWAFFRHYDRRDNNKVKNTVILRNARLFDKIIR